MNYDDEKKALEESVAGRVKNLRSMFEKKPSTQSTVTAPLGNADKKLARDKFVNQRVAEKEKKVKESYAQFKGTLDSVEHEAIRRQRERREAERKAEEEALERYRRIQSTKTLVDIAADSQKLREAEDRRVAQESREMYAKSKHTLDHDHVYKHAQKKRDEEQRAEREAKESLNKFTSTKSYFDEKLEEKKRKDEEERQKEAEATLMYTKSSYSLDHDHAYNHAQKKREAELRAEREAKQSLHKFSTGKTFLEEKLEEKKRRDEEERQKEMEARNAFAKNKYTSPDYDPAYLRAKELAAAEKEAEEKAKAALLQFSKVDESHNMVMINGVMQSKSAPNSSEKQATSYPFSDPSARSRKASPNPATLQALAKFQQHLAKSREAEKTAAQDDKQPITPDREQLQECVDESSLSVASAAQRFAEMERKAAASAKAAAERKAAELAKATSAKKQATSFEYEHAKNVRALSDQDRAKEQEAKDNMAFIQNSYSFADYAAADAKEKAEARRRAEMEAKRMMTKGSSAMSAFEMHLMHLRNREQNEREMEKEAKDNMTLVGVSLGRHEEFHFQKKEAENQERLSEKQTRDSWVRNSYLGSASFGPEDFPDLLDLDKEEPSPKSDDHSTAAAPAISEDEMATRIQRIARGHMERNSHRKRLDAVRRVALCMQCAFRRRKAIQHLHTLKDEKVRRECAALVIQRVLRGYLQRVTYKQTLAASTAAAVVLQATIRRRQALRQYRIRMGALLTIQDFMSRALSRRRAQLEYDEQTNAATKIQSTYKGYSVRRRTQVSVAAIVLIQATWRGKLGREVANKVRAAAAAEAARRTEEEDRRVAELQSVMAIKLQSHWRVALAKKQLSVLKGERDVKVAREQLEHATAIRIQAQWRSAIARSALVSLRAQAEEAKIAQLAQESSGATKIQSVWRAFHARTTVRQLREQAKWNRATRAAIRIQIAFRGYSAKRELAMLREAHIEQQKLREVEAVVKLQAVVRGHAGRNKFAFLKQEQRVTTERRMATRLQTAWRCSRARVQLATLKVTKRQERAAFENSTAIDIQRVWRGKQARVEARSMREENAQLAATAAAAAAAAAVAVMENPQSEQRDDNAVVDLTELDQRGIELAPTVTDDSSAAPDTELTVLPVVGPESGIVEQPMESDDLGDVVMCENHTEPVISGEVEEAQIELVADKNDHTEMALVIQRHWRGVVARQQVAERRSDAEKRAAARRDLEHAMAVKVQSHWRRLLAQSHVQHLRDEKAICIAAAQRQVELETAMAVKVQSMWRVRVAQHKVAVLRKDKEAAAAQHRLEIENQMALMIQCQWRSVVAQRRVRAIRKAQAEARETEDLMAVKIQSQWRSHSARQLVSLMREEKLAQEIAARELKSSMALKLQMQWRAFVARRQLAQLKADKSVRLAAERQHAIEIAMAVKIQSQWRCVLAGRRLRELQRVLEVKKSSSAVTIQSAWRGKVARDELTRRVNEQAARDAAIAVTIEETVDEMIDSIMDEYETAAITASAISQIESNGFDDDEDDDDDDELDTFPKEPKSIEGPLSFADLQELSMRGRFSMESADDSEEEDDNDELPSNQDEEIEFEDALEQMPIEVNLKDSSEGYTSANETAESTDASTPPSSNDVTLDEDNQRESESSYYRNTFDSSTPRVSVVSSARDSYIGFRNSAYEETLNDVEDAQIVKETEKEPQYFDTDSERGSLANERVSTMSDHDAPVSDRRANTADFSVEDEIEPASKGWVPTGFLNKFPSEKFVHVFETKSNGSTTASSKSNEDSPPTSGVGVANAVASGVGAILSRTASSAGRHLSLGQTEDLPGSNKSWRGASTASRSNSVEDEGEYEVVYSPTAQEAKQSKSKFGLFSSITATAAAAAPTSFTKRFGWKKSSEKQPKSNRNGFADDIPGMSTAA